jgi:hypothetical protein
MREKKRDEAEASQPDEPAQASATTAVEDGEDRTPEQIEAEIERTRDDLGETVAQLAEKADVKRQAKEKVEETKEAASEKASQARDRAIAGIRENPAPVAAGAAAVLVLFVILRHRRG